jgi:prophage DNA circulation protein
MTDWPSRLQPASFNGLGFHVESATIEAGHRVNTTTFPNGRHVNESFGPAARTFEVEAYLTGPACRERAAALLSAAESNHRGVLILPDAAPGLVRLTKATREFEKDKLGYISVSLEAVAEPAIATGGLSAFAMAARIFATALLARDAFGAFAGSAFRLAGQPSTVQDAAFEAAAGALGDLVALRDSVRLSPEALALAAPAFTAATVALADFPGQPAAFGLALADAAIMLGDVADPALLAQTIVSIGAPSDAAPAQVSRGTALLIAANAAEAVTLTAASRALALAEASARRSYRDRPEAVIARGIATAVFDDALSRAGRAGLDLARELSALRGLVAELVLRQEADLAPIITVSAGRRLPSLVWAHALYADPLRATELADRAGAYHPGFMPERFEALAN